MKQIFETDTEPEDVELKEDDVEFAIGFFQNTNKVNKVSVRNITPRWTKELPRPDKEEPYWMRTEIMKPQVLNILFKKELNIWTINDKYSLNENAIRAFNSEFSDRSVIMPED